MGIPENIKKLRETYKADLCLEVRGSIKKGEYKKAKRLCYRPAMRSMSRS